MGTMAIGALGRQKTSKVGPADGRRGAMNVLPTRTEIKKHKRMLAAKKEMKGLRGRVADPAPKGQDLRSDGVRFAFAFPHCSIH